MIQLNTPYIIVNEDDVVTFFKGKEDTISGKYTDGTLTGTLEGNVLSATFHNAKVNAVGLMEITFSEDGFIGKWKNGLEPGAIRGKWDGKLNQDLRQLKRVGNDQMNLNSYTGIDELSEILENLVRQPHEAQADFCKELVSFVQQNQAYLWLIPAYFQELYDLECRIDDGELEGSISGFLNKPKFVDELSTEIFSKQCMIYEARSGLFAWNEYDESAGLFSLILEEMEITLEDLIQSYNSEYRSEGQAIFNAFLNHLRTVLYASIVRAFYSEEYDFESIGCLISSPFEDENIREIESKTSGFGDAISWVIDDVLYCLNVDVNDAEFEEEWGNYSKNYEKMAEAISDQESYDTPLIVI